MATCDSKKKLTTKRGPKKPKNPAAEEEGKSGRANGPKKPRRKSSKKGSK